MFLFIVISKEHIKGAKNGMMINGVSFLNQPLCPIFRPELMKFEKNAWFISLDTEQLDAVVNEKPHFSKLYEYGRKLKDALELDVNNIVLFKPVRQLTDDEFKIISDEVIEHERAYNTLSRSNGVEVHELLEDYDDSNL
jgi:hypothetical protein